MKFIRPKKLFSSIRGRAINFFTQRKRQKIAKQYIRGAGIEIGALHLPLPVPNNAQVTYVDRMPTQDLVKHYPQLKKIYSVSPCLIDNGETLEKVRDNSQDFIIANHFIEHCENVLRTLEVFSAKLRAGGVLYLAIPDKRLTFDRKRKTTSLQHLIEEYENGPDKNRVTHFRDWVVNVKSKKSLSESDIENKIKELISKEYSIHFHVWDRDAIVELFNYMTTRLEGLVIETIEQNYDEIVVVCRKQNGITKATRQNSSDRANVLHENTL